MCVYVCVRVCEKECVCVFESVYVCVHATVYSYQHSNNYLNIYNVIVAAGLMLERCGITRKGYLGNK